MEQQSQADNSIDKPSDDVFKFQDNARRKLTVYEYWGYWDIHDNGETTAIVCAWVGIPLSVWKKIHFPRVNYHLLSLIICLKKKVFGAFLMLNS